MRTAAVEQPDLAVPQQPAASPARCADGHGTLTHIFFSHDDLEVARAKAMCRRCSLATTCLTDALERAEPYGVWGGVLLVDGEPTAVPPRRGRPSSTPRVEYVDDEVRRPEHLVA